QFPHLTLEERDILPGAGSGDRVPGNGNRM
ncbi:hypothetical protein A2U01_0050036, partial [Trifolium medium]|nr:hypothetical protein [Trifolium medium]